VSQIIKDQVIVVVEDDANVADTLRQWFERSNTVLVYRSAEEALEGLPAATPPTVCVLDYSLPKQNGIELYQQWKIKFPQAKYILISGKIDFETAEHVLNEGLDGLIQKPFDLPILEKNIADLLATT
jgi:DNA-binding NtrC family response regulator